MIITNSRDLKKHYHELGKGDVFIGLATFKHLRQSVLIDLLERGVRCFPSPLSQSLNSSKTTQALILKEYMLPHTCFVARLPDLTVAINRYNKNNIQPVITKEDQMHCGYGIRKWETVEALYSVMALSKSSYPFVMQPFLDKFIDVRVIIVGNYIEAYARHNPNNFRMNISAGGESHSYILSKSQQEFCNAVMRRGKFPYAHIDLMITENNECYLSEIALNGGIKGASISRDELDKNKRNLLVSLSKK